MKDKSINSSAKIILEGTGLWTALIMLVVGTLLVFIGLAIVGNSPETFTDFIVEKVAQVGTNESGELAVFWSLLVLGIPIGLLLNYFLRKKLKKDTGRELPELIGIELVLCMANFIYIIVFGKAVFSLTVLSIVVFINYLLDKRAIKAGLVCVILSYYSLLGIFAALNYLRFETGGSTHLIMILAGLVDIVVVAFGKRHDKVLGRTLMVMQVLIPLTILLYACERYLLNDELIVMSLPTIAKAIIGVGVVLPMIYALCKAIKNWRQPFLNVEKILLLPTIIIVFIVNSVSTNTNMVVPKDLHHTGEEVISYQQITSGGQDLYTDYAPVSGLYPVFIGSILEAIGGDMSCFNLAHAMFMAIFAGLTIFLASRHISRGDTLIIATGFALTASGNYDRAVWVALSMLVLMLPKLIKRRNLWLKAWLWVSFVGGLYYPAFGVAILAGTMPFAIMQAYKYYKSGDLKLQLKNWKFYGGWVVCLMPMVLSVPLLLKMLEHTSIYSGQTVLADGYSVFGQSIPDTFMPYIASGILNNLRAVIYYGLRYALPMMAIWLMVLTLGTILKKKDWKMAIKEPRFLMLLSGVIVMMIGYTGSIIRQDPNILVSRASYLIVPIFGIVFWIYLKVYAKATTTRYIMMAICFSMALILGFSPASLQDELSIQYAYALEDNYVQIPDELKDKYPRLGDGFIDEDILGALEYYRERVQNLREYKPDLSFYGLYRLGSYYILDVPAVGQPSSYASKDYKTHLEIVDAIKEQRPAIGMDISSQITNYYLFNWLMREESYVYDKDYNMFLPIELFRKIYGDDAEPTSKELVSWETEHAGRVADSLGQSLHSLEGGVMQKQSVNIMDVEEGLDGEKQEYSYKLKLDDKISGMDNDMLYLDFNIDGEIYQEKNESTLDKVIRRLSKQHYNDDIIVEVRWGNGQKNYMSASLGKGKLLIPVGANVTWLLEDHDEITITITGVDKKIDLEDIQFYRLRRIE